MTPRRLARGRGSAPALVTALIASALLAGCGGDEKGEPIPRASAAELTAHLNQIRDRIAARNACRDIKDEDNQAIDRILADLPESVDADVRTALEDSFKHLRKLTNEECEQIRAERERELQEEQEADDDGDGVPNVDDECPEELGVEENSGCPPVEVPTEPTTTETVPTEPEETQPEETQPDEQPEPTPSPNPKPRKPPKEPDPPGQDPNSGGEGADRDSAGGARRQALSEAEG